MLFSISSQFFCAPDSWNGMCIMFVCGCAWEFCCFASAKCVVDCAITLYSSSLSWMCSVFAVSMNCHEFCWYMCISRLCAFHVLHRHYASFACVFVFLFSVLFAFVSV
jgi:hypothetical protein